MLPMAVTLLLMAVISSSGRSGAYMARFLPNPFAKILPDILFTVSNYLASDTVTV